MHDATPLFLFREVFVWNTNGDTADNEVIYITFVEEDEVKTDATPDLTYTVGTLTDWSNDIAAETITFTGTVDKAGPAILSVVAFDTGDDGDGDDMKNDDKVFITFSENLSYNTSWITSSTHFGDVFNLNNGHVWMGDSSQAEAFIDNHIISLRLKDASASATLIDIGDTVTIDVTQLEGGISIIRDTRTPPNIPKANREFSAVTGDFWDEPNVKPTVVQVVTGDFDSDGTVDFLDIEFSEPVDDATAGGVGKFKVNGSNSTSVGGEPVPNDKYFRVYFPGATADDTTYTPTSLFLDNAIDDIDGMTMDDDTINSFIDKAPAVLLTAVAADAGTDNLIFTDDGDTLTLTFSEDLFDNDATLSLDDLGGNLFFGSHDNGIGTDLPSGGQATIDITGNVLTITAGATITPTSPAIAEGAVPMAIVANTNLSGNEASPVGVATYVTVNGLALGRRILIPADTAKVEPESANFSRTISIPTYPEYFSTQRITGEYTPLGAVPAVTWSTPSAARSTYRTTRSILDFARPQPTQQSSTPPAATHPAEEQTATDAAAGQTEAPPAAPAASVQTAPPTVGGTERANRATDAQPNIPPAPNTAPPVMSPGTGQQPAQPGTADRWFLIVLFALGVLAPLGYLGLRRRRNR